MLSRTGVLCTTLVLCAAAAAQQTSAPPPPSALREFPVTLQQSVESGKTKIGSKVQAKLVTATLVNGKVIPQNAILSGVVIESMAKSAKEPARLAIRVDSAQWKDGSASMRAYLTPLFYPATAQAGQDLQYGPPEPASKTWNGAGQYPSADSRVYQPFPGSDSDKNHGAIPDTPTSITSSRPVMMKNVGSAPTNDGGIALISAHANLKLDKLTIYVLVSGDEAPPK